MNSIEIFDYELIDVNTIYKGESIESIIIRLMESKGVKMSGTIVKKPIGILTVERDVENNKYIVNQEIL